MLIEYCSNIRHVTFSITSCRGRVDATAAPRKLLLRGGRRRRDSGIRQMQTPDPQSPLTSTKVRLTGPTLWLPDGMGCL